MATAFVNGTGHYQFFGAGFAAHQYRLIIIRCEGFIFT
jgi:hypothetical protein